MKENKQLHAKKKIKERKQRIILKVPFTNTADLNLFRFTVCFRMQQISVKKFHTFRISRGEKIVGDGTIFIIILELQNKNHAKFLRIVFIAAQCNYNL